MSKAKALAASVLILALMASAPLAQASGSAEPVIIEMPDPVPVTIVLQPISWYDFLLNYINWWRSIEPGYQPPPIPRRG